MPYLRIDGKKLHRSKVPCEGTPCVNCLRFGQYYAQQTATILGVRPFRCDGTFYVKLPLDEPVNAVLQRLQDRFPGGRYVTRHFTVEETDLSDVELCECARQTVSTPASRRIGSVLAHVADPKRVRELLGIKDDFYDVLEPGEENCVKEVDGVYCSSCDGHGIPSSGREALAFIDELRGPDRREIGQYHVDLEGLLRRVKYINRHEVIRDTRVLCVGDNDLTSLALCTLAFPKEVTVVDLDDKVINTIEKTARERNFPIRTVRFDIRDVAKGVTPDVGAPHDLFVSDPPYATDGLKSFMWLGAKNLVNGGRGYVALPSSDLLLWTIQQAADIQRFLSANGMVITERHQGFHTYASEKGLPSAMMKVHKFGEVLTVPDVNVEKFYTD